MHGKYDSFNLYANDWAMLLLINKHLQVATFRRILPQWLRVLHDWTLGDFSVIVFLIVYLSFCLIKMDVSAPTRAGFVFRRDKQVYFKMFYSRSPLP